MITDYLTKMCDATALNTGAAGTYLIGSQIDLGAARDLGQFSGEPLYLVIKVTTTATSGGSATGTFKLVSDDTAAISTTTSTVHVTTPTFTVANMVAGTELIVVALPLEGNAYEQFLGILQVTATAAFTAGAIEAFIVAGTSSWKAYANGVV